MGQTNGKHNKIEKVELKIACKYKPDNVSVFQNQLKCFYNTINIALYTNLFRALEEQHPELSLIALKEDQPTLIIKFIVDGGVARIHYHQIDYNFFI